VKFKTINLESTLVKQFVFLLTLFIGLPLFGQEFQTDLIENPVLRPSPYKTTESNAALCGINSFLTISINTTNKPDCNEANGLIEISISGSDDTFEYYLNSELVDAGPQKVESFGNLLAGAYLIEVLGNEGSYISEFIVLSNQGQNLDQVGSEFDFSPAFCGLGNISKGPGIVTQPTNYSIFNSNRELVGNCSNLFCDLDFPPGDYYIQLAQSVSNCEAFFKFEILDIPTNPFPFIEDFSKVTGTPDVLKWADNQAFINSSFANNPLSIGVATLDGLNEFGLPYTVSDIPVNGSADSLTSHPFCLAGIQPDSLCLSFYFQPQGISDFPNDVDSLIAEVKDNLGNWHHLWGISGMDVAADPAINNENFTYVITTIKNKDDFEVDQTFFEDGLQFRFRNKATTTGLNDPWHIDYVRLENCNLVQEEQIENDITFVFESQTLLNRYSSMPWHQFYDYQDLEFSDTLGFFFRLNGSDPSLNADGFYSIYEFCDDIPIESNMDPFNISGEVNQTQELRFNLLTSTLDDLSIGKPDDANVVLRTEYIMDTDGDFNTQNDTLIHNQVFADYYSYDDGTAEKAFGLLGSGSELAVAFQLNEPDVVQGIQIYFTHIIGNTADNAFALKAWAALDFDNELDFSRNDSVIGIKEGLFPVYTGQIGGFTTYLFDEPVEVDSIFYVGLEQLGPQFLNIGHDINNIVFDTSRLIGDTLIEDFKHRYAGGNVFYNSVGIWQESIIPGAVMIRPLLGDRDRFVTNIETIDTKPKTLTVYPNPSSDYINLNVASVDDIKTVSILDQTGRTIQTIVPTNLSSISVSDLVSGIYFIELIDQKGKKQVGKFVKY